ncbi:MAG: 50S ribosomal protein L17 [Treponemataceae bacterium]
MKHKIGFNRLDRNASHRKALHRNMVTSLFDHERVHTTKAKALEVRKTAEKMITRAKEDTVHNRRLIARRLYNDGVIAKLFTNIAPRMKERNGGYTRIIKLGARLGDAAEVVILELVDYKLDVKEKADDKKTAAKKPAAKKVAEKKSAAKSSAKDETAEATAKKAAPKKTTAKKPAAKAEAK